MVIAMLQHVLSGQLSRFFLTIQECKQTPGCGSWQFCPNPDGCDIGCLHYVNSLPPPTKRGATVHGGFGPYGGCQGDKFPAFACSLKVSMNGVYVLHLFIWVSVCSLSFAVQYSGFAFIEDFFWLAARVGVNERYESHSLEIKWSKFKNVLNLSL